MNTSGMSYPEAKKLYKKGQRNVLGALTTAGTTNPRLNNESVLSDIKADTHRSSEQMMEMLQTLQLPHVGAGFNKK